MDSEEKLKDIEDVIVNHYAEDDEPFTEEHLRMVIDSIVEIVENKESNEPVNVYSRHPHRSA
jgi:hypothetical protein